MSKLSTKARKALPKSDFGLPGSEKYPMPNKSHARNAKARASEMVKKGKLSESSKTKIDAKANKILEGEQEMSRASVPLSDKDWQARNDADVLMRAREIEANKARLSAARKVAATEAKRFAQVATSQRKPAAPAKK